MEPQKIHVEAVKHSLVTRIAKKMEETYENNTKKCSSYIVN